jgi:lipopolysaccharide exporter
MSSSKLKVFRNVIYSTAGKGATLLCIAVTSSIVARNLSPSDYGVVGFSGIVIGFLAHFSDVGVGSAAVRRPELTERNLQSAFTLKIILGCCAFAAAYAVAPFAHHFFNHPATANIIRVLAFDFLISTIGFMPNIVLTREQNYRALIVPGIMATIVRSVLAIALVLHGWRFWAVVLADVGANIAGSFAIQLTRAVPIRLEFDAKDMREYLNFGIPLLGGGILVFLVMNSDNFLVGSMMGSVSLGYYALAFNWGSFICGLLYDTVNNVLFPAFSAIQHDKDAIRRWYLKTVDMVGFVAVIANTALLANVHFFLVTFLGKGTDKWLPAAAALQILCIYGIVRTITEPLANCIMALAQTKVLLYANLLAGGLEVVSIASVLRLRRIDLVACAVFIAYVSQGCIYLPFLRRNLGVGIWNIVGQLWPIAPAVIGGYWLTGFLPATFGYSMLTLAIRGLFTGCCTALIHGLFTRFRCVQEAGGMIWANLARVRA